MRMRGSSTEVIGTKRRRENGTFASIGIMTGDKRMRAEKRRSYNAGKDFVTRRNFDSFLQVFFLPGSVDDWVPVSSNSGPLVNLVHCLFKTDFLLSQEERSKQLYLVVAGGDPRDIWRITKRISTRDATVSEGPLSRVRIFTGRRLPRIENYASEIEPVREWVREHFDRGFLKGNFSDEAFSICINMIKSCVTVNGKRAYNGYPKTLPRSTSKGSSDISSSAVEVSNGTTSEQDTPSQQHQQPSNQPTVVSEDSGRSSQESERTAIGEQNDITRGRGNAAFAGELSSLFELSHDDARYCILALLFDKDSVNKYEMIAGAFVQKDPKLVGNLDKISNDVLIYAHWNCFGIKDCEEHERRFKYLRLVYDLATDAREAYGLRPYSELRDIYF